jgi:hypothetical protein
MAADSSAKRAKLITILKVSAASNATKRKAEGQDCHEIARLAKREKLQASNAVPKAASASNGLVETAQNDEEEAAEGAVQEEAAAESEDDEKSGAPPPATKTTHDERIADGNGDDRCNKQRLLEGTLRYGNDPLERRSYQGSKRGLLGYS